ncbi:hypothetical protein F5Y12DRAFT_763907 [Xylaria sp. FL1777]|nr:hypothetical protein F5Y12DRAFT_763907 [Xylaria sp. FL1777]
MVTTTPLTASLKSWILPVLLSMASLSLPSQAAPQVSQLYQFTYPTAVENLISLPNGCLLLSTSASDLYYIDPEALYPAAQNVISLPDSIRLTGLAALGDGFYAVAGSVSPPSNSRGCMQVYVIKVETEGLVNVTVDHVIEVPNTVSIGGIATLPSQSHTILGADSIGGRILRINTSDGTVSVAVEHATARGVKGLKTRGGYLYFTNSAQRIFGRFPIDANGTNTGDVEILASIDEAYGRDASYNDFSFDDEGNAFVAVHPSSVHKITPDGVQSVFAGGVNSTMLGPTSAVVSSNEKAIYISTAGKDTGFPISGGQVLKVPVGGTCT